VITDLPGLPQEARNVRRSSRLHPAESETLRNDSEQNTNKFVNIEIPQVDDKHRQHHSEDIRITDI
jgi:hypothetical protein